MPQYRSKVIKIPIYYAQLTVILFDKVEDVVKKYKLKTKIELASYGALAFRVPDDYRHYAIALETDWRANVVHEIIHVINYLYADLGIDLDLKNDEPQAYLAGWLFDEIDKFLVSIEEKDGKKE
jgi:hypothetical protein